MASEKPVCSKCGQDLEQQSGPDDSVCAKCALAEATIGSDKTALATSGLLPPRRKALSELPTRQSGLLPPQRRRSISVDTKRDRETGRDAAWVILPDALGGFQRVSNRSVRVSEGGTEVHLASRPREAALRHRILVNLVSILLGLAILFAVFWMAVNGWL